MSDQLELFHFEEGKKSFEDFGHDNGFHFWYASDFMGMLGYKSWGSFQKSINKAIGVCTSLSIPIEQNFIPTDNQMDGRKIKDYRLSRFACYLTAMNGDSKNPLVAKAQAYFVTMAEAFRQYVQEEQEIGRFIVRDEISIEFYGIHVIHLYQDSKYPSRFLLLAIHLETRGVDVEFEFTREEITRLQHYPDPARYFRTELERAKACLRDKMFVW